MHLSSAISFLYFFTFYYELRSFRGWLTVNTKNLYSQFGFCLLRCFKLCLPGRVFSRSWWLDMSVVFLAFVIGYMWPHVCAFMHMCTESVCSYAFWLADPIALAVMCRVLLNWFVERDNERMHRGKETKLEGRWTGLLTWCFINTTQPPPFPPLCPVSTALL